MILDEVLPNCRQALQEKMCAIRIWIRRSGDPAFEHNIGALMPKTGLLPMRRPLNKSYSGFCGLKGENVLGLESLE